MSCKGTEIRCYAVWTTAMPEHETYVYAPTSGRAKYWHWLEVKDAWQDFPITGMRARRVKAPAPEHHGFRRVAEYRGWPNAICGVTRVRCEDGSEGIIVGHSSSANFKVVFDSGPLAGGTCNVHPASCREIPHE